VVFSVVRFSNRKEYAEAVRESRLKELACGSLMSAIKCGLASVIPLQLLSVLTSQDLALRVCGKPDINLEYLKVRASTQWWWFRCSWDFFPLI